MSGATPDRQIIFSTSVQDEMSNGKPGLATARWAYQNRELAKRKAGAIEHSVAVAKPVLRLREVTNVAGSTTIPSYLAESLSLNAISEIPSGRSRSSHDFFTIQN